MDKHLASPTFRYQPLAKGHIRLLGISKNGEGWTHSLTDVNLTTNPNFLALSYTWGDGKRDQVININGSVMTVLASIKTVLPYLYERYPSCRFWIDGICINQDDLKEKEVQIPMMRDIYTKASKCIIWLGESNGNIDSAIAEIPRLLEETRGGHAFSDVSQDVDVLRRYGIMLPVPQVREGLMELLSRPWFERVWTFQEAVLPKTLDILCGTSHIPFEYLLRLSEIMTDESGSLGAILQPVNEVETALRRAKTRIQVIQSTRKYLLSAVRERYSFLDLLHYSWSWKCTRPVDKIYGLLGLRDSPVLEQLVVDCSLPEHKVFLDFARLWIPRDKHLQLLHMASSWDRSKDNGPGVLPTWCPDFSRTRTVALLVPEPHAPEYWAGSKTGMTSRVSLLPNSNTLHIHGFRLTEVTNVLPCPYNRQHHTSLQARNDSINRLLEWEEKCLRLSQHTYGSEGGAVPSAHWQTLTACRRRRSSTDLEAEREIYHLARSVMQQLVMQENIDTREVTQDQMSRFQYFANELGWAIPDRNFFSTGNGRGRGRVGLGPMDTRVGDVVCILFGGHTPYILRPKSSSVSGASFEFVGETYLDGFMDGEALEGMKEGDGEDFVIE